MAIDRAKNKPVADFLLEENQEINVNEIILKVNQLGNMKNAGQAGSNAVLMMRLHFLVHSFINLYVWDPVNKAELIG